MPLSLHHVSGRRGGTGAVPRAVPVALLPGLLLVPRQCGPPFPPRHPCPQPPGPAQGRTPRHLPQALQAAAVA